MVLSHAKPREAPAYPTAVISNAVTSCPKGRNLTRGSGFLPCGHASVAALLRNDKMSVPFIALVFPGASFHHGLPIVISNAVRNLAQGSGFLLCGHLSVAALLRNDKMSVPFIAPVFPGASFHHGLPIVISNAVRNFAQGSGFLLCGHLSVAAFSRNDNAGRELSRAAP